MEGHAPLNTITAVAFHNKRHPERKRMLLFVFITRIQKSFPTDHIFDMFKSIYQQTIYQNRENHLDVSVIHFKKAS